VLLQQLGRSMLFAIRAGLLCQSVPSRLLLLLMLLTSVMLLLLLFDFCLLPATLVLPA
jgi:hypothetical protein